MTPPFVDAEDSAIATGPEWIRPFPARTGCTVTPLIEAADMFPALENLVIEAESAVWMSFRIFDPATKTRSDAAGALGLASWSDLIRHAVKRGVEVRILLADFEPVLADYLHAGSWNTYRQIRAIVEGLEESERDRLQLIVIQHEGELGWGWRQLLRVPLRRRVRKIVEGLLVRGAHEDGGFDCRPGLWKYLVWEGDEAKSWKAAAPPRLWPATYHQKFVLIDRRIAIIGGLDLDERRWDDRRHRRSANQTWHDISARIDGPAASDAERHFALLWNRELPRYRSIVAEWTTPCGRELMLDPLDSIEGVRPESRSADGKAVVQIVRTLSRRSSSPFAIGPKRHIRELKAAHRRLILSARRRLYIEAQFFRSAEAAEWIEQALRANPALEAIILIANAPEEIAFEGQGDNPAHRYGEYLQARTLGRLLRRSGPDRIGLFTLAKSEPVQPGEEKFEDSRGTAFGSGLIHIHSKLLIADDDFCLLSSANINGRSFYWDTELGFLWREESDAIKDFRDRLWRQLFADAPPADLAGWRDAARFNAGAPPDQRKGFVLPYQLGRARRFARPYSFIPDDLV